MSQHSLPLHQRWPLETLLHSVRSAAQDPALDPVVVEVLQGLRVALLEGIESIAQRNGYHSHVYEFTQALIAALDTTPDYNLKP